MQKEVIGKVIREYRLFVLDNGEIITEEVKKDKLDLPDMVRHCSVKVAQLIALLMFIEKTVAQKLKNNEIPDFKEIYLDGLEEMSKVFKTEKSTIRDKSTRKLGIDTKTFVQLIEDYYMYNNYNLQTVLINSIRKDSETACHDLGSIDEYFSHRWF